MEKINIIIVNDYGYVEGGAGAIAITSAIALAKKGYNIIFFTAVEPIDERLRENNIKIVSCNQFDILNHPNRAKAIIQGIWNTESLKKMKVLLAELSPSNTILHVHTWTKAISTSAINYSLQKNFKVIFTLHDYFMACPNGGFFDYKKNEICKNCQGLKCLVTNCDRRSYLHKLWRYCRHLQQTKVTKLPKKVKYYIFVSEFSKKILDNYLPENSCKYILSNPIDIQKEERVGCEKNNSFIFLGRITEEKGAILLAKAVRLMDLNLVFIGEGNAKPLLQAMLPKARFTGWLNKEQIIEEFKKARALIFSSSLYETQGLTVLEAASMGVPSIISDTSAAKEFVKNNENGVYFENLNPEDLVEKINLLKNNDQLVKTYSEASYKKFWNSNYSLEQFIEKLQQIYKDILQE